MRTEVNDRDERTLDLALDHERLRCKVLKLELHLTLLARGDLGVRNHLQAMSASA